MKDNITVCVRACLRAYVLGGGVTVPTAAKSRECTISIIADMSSCQLRYYVLQCSMTMARADYARNKVIIVLLDAMPDP
jgi:hypothetical protein